MRLQSFLSTKVKMANQALHLMLISLRFIRANELDRYVLRE